MNEQIESVAFLKKLNEELGYSLEPLNRPKHPLLGREQELKTMDYILHRPDTPILELVGDAGVGKTALVETWREREEKRSGKNIILLSLNFGKLSADGIETLKNRVSILIGSLKKFEELANKEDDKETEVVLFMDEFHLLISIFGATKIGGDLIKPSLARTGLRVITATTRQEHDAYIATDEALARRLKVVEIQQLSDDKVRDVLRGWLVTKLGKTEADKISDQTLRYIIQSNKEHRPHFAEPASSLDICETMVGICKVDNVPFDTSLVKKAFKLQYSIDLDRKIDFRKVKDIVNEEVKGQPLALYTLDHELKKISFGMERNGKPLASMIFAGTTGTGKAIADYEKVPVYQGSTIRFKPHGALCVGDKVVGSDGKPTRVLRVIDNGLKKVYRVYFDDGTSVDCNDEHLWRVYKDDNDKSNVLTLKSIMRDIKDHDYYIPMLDNFTIPTQRRAVYDDKALTIGNTIHHSDKMRMFFSSEELHYMNLSKNRLPERVVKANSETQIKALRGYIMQNGYTMYHGDDKRIAISFADRGILRQIRFILDSNGFNYVVRDFSDRKTIEDGFRGFTIIFTSSPESVIRKLKMPSVYAISTKINSDLPSCAREGKRKIVEIKDLQREVNMKCIEVENKDHLYCVTENFILTHNTQTVKALGKGLYGDVKNMMTLSMTDFKESGSEVRFRRLIGKTILHNPTTIILLDELEKASSDTLETLYPILDEGTVTFEEDAQDGYTITKKVSLRNAIIIATTNAGQELMNAESKFGKTRNRIDTNNLNSLNEDLAKSWRSLENDLVDALIASGIPDALIGRFDQIVPYLALNDHSKLAIVRSKLDKLIRRYRDEKGIEIVLPKEKNWSAYGYDHTADPISMFVVFDRNSGEDSEKGGARKLERTVNKDIDFAILDAIFKYPNYKKFVIKTNGKSGFETDPNGTESSMIGNGEIIVEPYGR